MNQITQLVVEKTGLSEDQAQQAVDVVLNHLKSKLPEPLAAQLDSLINGDASGLEGEAEAFLKGKLGGLFGG